MPSDQSTERKRRAAEAAVRYIESGMVLGVGTGSTVNQLIEVLKDRKIQLSGTVSSSRQTSEQLRAAGLDELELNTSGDVELYMVRAELANAEGELTKGGGGQRRKNPRSLGGYLFRRPGWAAIHSSRG